MLDNWVHEFSTEAVGQPVHDTGFPILKEEASWHVGPCGSGKDSGSFRIRRLPDAVKTVIKAAQPFETSLTPISSQRTALRRLHLLDIRDKHQALNVVTANMDVVGWGVPEGTTGDVRYRIYRGEVLELHTPKPILLVELPNRSYFDMSVHPSADFQVVLLDEISEAWPIPGLSNVLGGFLNAVAYLIHLLNFARETGKAPLFPIEPGSE